MLKKFDGPLHASSVFAVLFFFHCCILNTRFSIRILKKGNFLNAFISLLNLIVTPELFL